MFLPKKLTRNGLKSYYRLSKIKIRIPMKLCSTDPWSVAQNVLQVKTISRVFDKQTAGESVNMLF